MAAMAHKTLRRSQRILKVSNVSDEGIERITDQTDDEATPSKKAKLSKIKNGRQENIGEKISNLENRLDNQENESEAMKSSLTSNRGAIDCLDSKMDKIILVLNKSWEDKKENLGLKTYYPFYGNVMSCLNFFDMKGLMTNTKYDTVQGNMPCRDVAREIMSYLDYESLVAARMVSKDLYKFLEKQRSNIWVQKMWIKYETSLRSRNLDLVYIKPDWKQLGQKIEKNGTVADIVSFVQKLAKATFEEYPLETIQTHKKYEEVSKEIVWRDLSFLKVLIKFKFLTGTTDCDFFVSLLRWATADVNVLAYVIPIAQNSRIYKKCNCVDPHNDNSSHPVPLENYGKNRICPVERIIRNDLGVDKLRMLLPLITKKFWNSGGQRCSPLVDAIMIGNMDMVQEIIQHTKINAKNKRFESYLHVAAKFGQFEIFKLIFGLVKDWRDLKDRHNRNILETLSEDNYQMEFYNKETCKIEKAKKATTTKVKNDMIKFLPPDLKIVP